MYSLLQSQLFQETKPCCAPEVFYELEKQPAKEFLLIKMVVGQGTHLLMKTFISSSIVTTLVPYESGGRVGEKTVAV